MKHGMAVSRSVSGNTHLVVIGSEEVETNAVQKAREAGLAIMLESIFWQRLGEM
jgi:NAD-dependent DNA ligase